MEVSYNGVTPKSSKSLDHFSIETHGDFGIPHFKNPHIYHVLLEVKTMVSSSLGSTMDQPTRLDLANLLAFSTTLPKANHRTVVLAQ